MGIRVEPFIVGDFLHVYNRGNRKMTVFPKIEDKWRFLKILRYFNDQNSSADLFKRMLRYRGFDPRHPFKFEWPESWPPQQPLVKILTYCLRDNHFHLLLKEIRKGGISFFMKKLGDGFTGFINLKYDQVGKVFQGSYKGKRIPIEEILQYVDAYIQVFNIFEEYSGGIRKAMSEFDKAFEFALNNPFSSLGESFGKRNLKIIDKDILKELFSDLKGCKEFCRDAIIVHNIEDNLGKLTNE